MRRCFISHMKRCENYSHAAFLLPLACMRHRPAAVLRRRARIIPQNRISSSSSSSRRCCRYSISPASFAGAFLSYTQDAFFKFHDAAHGKVLFDTIVTPLVFSASLPPNTTPPRRYKPRAQFDLRATRTRRLEAVHERRVFAAVISQAARCASGFATVFFSARRVGHAHNTACKSRQLH